MCKIWILWACINTFTIHFITYALLVLSWIPFCLQNCPNSSWHRFNKVMETFLKDFVDMITSRRCCRFVSCTSMMQTSCSTSSQRFRLRSGDCRGHLSSDLTAMFKKPVWLVITGWSATTFRLWCLNDAQLLQRDLKCAKKTSLRPLQTPPPLWNDE